jgi:hypothetical protein
MSIYNKPMGLYIGCGIDIQILTQLRYDISQCIYIDSQPFTCYGDILQNNLTVDKINDKYMLDFSKNANKEGFIKISIDGVYPHVYKNYNTNQEIFHYFNLSIPMKTIKNNYAGNTDEIKKLINQLNYVTHIIVIGYSPHYSIFKYIVNNVTFVGNHSTLYNEKLDDLLNFEKDKITIVLQKNLYNIRNRINKYIYLDKNMKKHEVDDYNNFIKLTFTPF